MTDKPDVKPLSARELILALVDSTSASSLSASYLIAAAELFSMEPSSIRVALARLVREGSLRSAGRGRYGLGSRGGTLHSLVRSWAKAEASLKPWSGGWMTVLVGHLSRSNKTRRRGNERALGLFGFAEARTGLWLRPANLRRSLEELRADLVELGLDPEAICLNASELVPEATIDAQSLWDTPALEARYRKNVERLEQSTARLATLDEHASARETLLVGRLVTRDILLDPMLPDPLVDVVARRAMIDAMRAYDQLGKSYWRRFFKREGADQKPAA